MSKKHQLILEKLQKYPPSVQRLAKRALEMAESTPESSIAEQLKGEVRNIVRSEKAAP